MIIYYGNQQVGVSDCSNGNVEIIGFDPRDYGYGTYTVKIIPVSNNTDTNTYFSVAWW